MNNKPDDVLMLSAYIDNELSESQRQAVEQRLEEDACLRALYSRLQQSEHLFRLNVSAIDSEPPSPALMHILQSPEKHSTNVVSLTLNRLRHNFHRRFQHGLAAAAALVAVTALLFLQGRLFDRQSAVPILAEVRFDSGEVAEALGSIVAGKTVKTDNGELTEVLAFSRRDGVLCKHIVLQQSRESLDAVACFENGGWARMAADLSAAGTDVGMGYQLADGFGGLQVESYIYSVIDGTSLSPEQERTLMEDLGLLR